MRFRTLFLLATSFLCSTSLASAETGETYFIVTAYYSPLPDQASYFRGSYEADISLNGSGTHGASGRPVYMGMLAAPKNYSFGTTIYLEGIGTGVVDDRGGAIVEAGKRGHQYDRLDIWMGHGDEGLSRALAWGRRVVPGKVLSGSLRSEASFSLPKATALKKKSPTWHDFFTAPITESSSVEARRFLRQVLSDLGYDDCSPEKSDFDSATRACIGQFQIDKGLIAGPKDRAFGYLWPATRKALVEAYSSFLIEEEKVRDHIRQELASLESLARSHQERTKSAEKALKALKTPAPFERGAHIRAAQESLRTLGYFSAQSTGIFGPKTEVAWKSWRKDYLSRTVAKK